MFASQVSQALLCIDTLKVFHSKHPKPVLLGNTISTYLKSFFEALVIRSKDVRVVYII